MLHALGVTHVVTEFALHSGALLPIHALRNTTRHGGRTAVVGRFCHSKRKTLRQQIDSAFGKAEPGNRGFAPAWPTNEQSRLALARTS